MVSTEIRIRDGATLFMLRLRKLCQERAKQSTGCLGHEGIQSSTAATPTRCVRSGAVSMTEKKLGPTKFGDAV